MSEETDDRDLDRILREDFTTDFRTAYIEVRGVCLPEYYSKFADAIENLKVRDDDVWVCSFPKTGTTWTQEMIWCIANDLNFEGAKIGLTERFPFLDHSALFDYRRILARTLSLEFPDFVLDSVSYIEKMPSPRFIKSHLPFELLPRQLRDGTRKPKIVYVARNPKDTCISYFNHAKLLEGYRGNFYNFCKLFLAGKLCFAPFWKHVLGFWNKEKDDNILFLKYEDMKEDLVSVIRMTANFLGKSLDDNDIEALSRHLSFESMKENPAVNYEKVIEMNKKFKLIVAEGTFMRNGEKDQWKNEMTSDMKEKFDDFTTLNLRDSGLSFS